MTERLFSVSDAAELLDVHPKTVLRYIRNGQLPASRIGKAYRIRRADLEAFAGLPRGPREAARVTCIIDVPQLGDELAQKWAATVISAIQARPPGGGTMRADTIYDPERDELKIVLVGPPRDTAHLMELISLWLEQLR